MAFPFENLDVYNLINLKTQDVEEWADAIEARDDIGFEIDLLNDFIISTYQLQ